MQAGRAHRLEEQLSTDNYVRGQQQQQQQHALLPVADPASTPLRVPPLPPPPPQPQPQPPDSPPLPPPPDPEAETDARPRPWPARREPAPRELLVRARRAEAAAAIAAEELAQLQELYEQLPATLGNHQYLMADVSHSADSISCACSKVERSLDAVRLELQAATTSGWQALEQVIANGDRAELRMTLRTLIDRVHTAACCMEKFPCTVKPQLARIHAHVHDIHGFAGWIGSFSRDPETYKQKMCGQFYDSGEGWAVSGVYR